MQLIPADSVPQNVLPNGIKKMVPAMEGDCGRGQQCFRGVAFRYITRHGGHQIN
jgi:hypothetical protein